MASAKTTGVLHPTAAFVELGLLLERLEAEANGVKLSEQSVWNEQRLTKAGAKWLVLLKKQFL